MSNREYSHIQVMAAMRYLVKNNPVEFKMEHLENHVLVLYQKSRMVWKEVQRVSVFDVG